VAGRILISFDPEAGTHRIRNYAEALSLAVPEIGGCFLMEEADRATDRLVITTIQARRLKRVLALAVRLLSDHHLNTVTTVALHQLRHACSKR
jgi:hypothetical protein